MVQYCFTSTETRKLVRTDSLDVHIDSHTTPELCGHRPQLRVEVVDSGRMLAADRRRDICPELRLVTAAKIPGSLEQGTALRLGDIRVAHPWHVI